MQTVDSLKEMDIALWLQTVVVDWEQLFNTVLMEVYEDSFENSPQSLWYNIYLVDFRCFATYKPTGFLFPINVLDSDLLCLILNRLIMS